MLDVFFAVISAIPTVWLTYIALDLALKPPKKSDAEARSNIKRKIKILAGWSIVAIAMQAYRAKVENTQHAEASVEYVGLVPTVKASESSIISK